MGQVAKTEQAAALDELPDFEAHRFVPADENQTEDENYILRTVNEGLKETLWLGWILPPDRLVLDKKVKEVTVYSARNAASVGKLIGPISKSDLKETRDRFQMICDPYSNYFVYRLTGPAVDEPERAVVASGAFPNTQVGYRKIELQADNLDKALEALEGKGKNIHRYRALQTTDGQFVYSFHAFYDPSSKQLVKLGIILQGAHSKVIGKSVERFDPAQNCNDCGLPLLDDPIEKAFDPINLFQTSLFPNPLVLLRSAPSGARSLSLVTFDAKGHKWEVWASESLADCGDK